MRAKKSAAVIVGSRDDPHVRAVESHLASALIFDLESFIAGKLAVSAAELLCLEGSEWVPAAVGTIGWIRRLAPSGWSADIQPDTPEAVRLSGHFSALAGLIRTAPLGWVTELDALVVGENKLVQQLAAQRCGIAYPAAAVAPSPCAASDVLGTDDLVVKPIGASTLLVEGSTRGLITTAVETLADGDYVPESMLYQRRVRARRHLRIVTVGSRSWSFSLTPDAATPLDWRSDAKAHDSFESVFGEPASALAEQVAAEMKLGFSSQDWIDDGDETWLVDVNPAGQWLFLPDGGAIAAAIAAHLSCGYL